MVIQFVFSLHLIRGHTNIFAIIFRLAKFVDTFGARPSGSEELESSIDYMIQLTKDEDIADVRTEEVEVRLT